MPIDIIRQKLISALQVAIARNDDRAANRAHYALRRSGMSSYQIAEYRKHPPPAGAPYLRWYEINALYDQVCDIIKPIRLPREKVAKVRLRTEVPHDYANAAAARRAIRLALGELEQHTELGSRYTDDGKARCSLLRSVIWYARAWLRARNEPGGYAREDKTCGIRE